jgi:4-hydroxymandelate oxidase
MPTRRRSEDSFRTLGDLEEAARRAADETVWGYIQGGAGAERTLRANEEAFSRWTIVPDPLRDVRSVDLRTTLLGTEVAAPFFVAPTAYLREVHAGGERATAAAASRLRVLSVVSTLSSDSVEEIAAAAGAGPRWFQLYLQPDPGTSVKLVRRAERAGFTALVVTVDAPVLGSRDRQGRSGFALETTPPVGAGSEVRTPPRGPTWDGGRYVVEGAAELSWPAIERVAQATSLPLVVKGLLSAEAAHRALEVGAKAIVVSNHGGRQLDLAPAALDALPEIVAEVGTRAEVYVDGGVRRGSDVLVALALGARAVGIGRPILWALAAGGRAGVDRYLRLLGTELANSLVLAGRRNVKEVDGSLLRPGPARTAPPAEAAANPGRPWRGSSSGDRGRGSSRPP